MKERFKVVMAHLLIVILMVISVFIFPATLMAVMALYIPMYIIYGKIWRNIAWKIVIPLNKVIADLILYTMKADTK